jgi:hypothetical protein
MLKKTHRREMNSLARANTEALTVLGEKYERDMDAEYSRATKDGMAKVHAWARDITWELFTADNQNPTVQINQLKAAMQQAEQQFNPKRY